MDVSPAPSRTSSRHTPSPDHSEPPEVPCDLVTVPARQGLEAVDIIRRSAGPDIGPVLHDRSCDTLGFVVPSGTAAAWDVPGSACIRTDGRGLRIPVGEAVDVEPTSPELSASPPLPAPLERWDPHEQWGPPPGSGWLLPPGDDVPVTDPAVLRAALDEAARLIEAADNCR
ncbi:hypothetical protein GCM10020367_24110 [Streptomyces sannanensis]|uniref:Uncharacterized protein n=1 Tax=Streptomyces sannanensis TaxID=285536 RepID=A0ABP6SA66_9ACTN